MPMQRHYIFYGDPGGGKTHCAATGELPSIVINFEGIAKAEPYLTTPHIFDADGFEALYNLNGRKIPVERVMLYNQSDTLHKSPQRIIINLVDNDPENDPTAWQLFKYNIWPVIDGEMQRYHAQTLIIDSTTMMQLAFRNFALKHTEILKQRSEQGVALAMTDALESFCISLTSKPYNTILICHIGKEKENVHGASESVAYMPGRMARGAFAMHSDTYRIFVDITGKYQAQCAHDGFYIARNSVNAPAICSNSLLEITKNAPVIKWNITRSASAEQQQ